MKPFENKIAIVTGGAQGIGKCIQEEFEKQGAAVCIIDLLDNSYFRGDLVSQETLERFAGKVISDYGHVDYLISNAAPLSRGIASASYADFESALKAGVTAPFYLTKLFLPNAAIVNQSCFFLSLDLLMLSAYNISVYMMCVHAERRPYYDYNQSIPKRKQPGNSYSTGNENR